MFCHVSADMKLNRIARDHGMPSGGELTMTPTLPLCCSPRSFNLLKRQIRSINSPDSLLQGAIAISMHQMEDVDAAAVDATIQKYVDTVRSRVRGRQPQAIIAHLHEFLFEELKLRGNTDDYYNPLNSYLPALVEQGEACRSRSACSTR